MKDYKITISVSDVDGTYSVKDFEEANKIARAECENIYAKLNGRCTVEIKDIEEVKRSK